MTHPYVLTLIEYIQENDLSLPATQNGIRKILYQIKFTNELNRACNQNFQECLGKVAPDKTPKDIEEIHFERALMKAVVKPDCTEEIIDIFCEAGVNLEHQIDHRTVLMWAALNNKPGAIRSLVDHGAKVDNRSSDASRTTALLLAATRKHKEAALQLIRCGANVHLKDRGHGGGFLRGISKSSGSAWYASMLEDFAENLASAKQKASSPRLSSSGLALIGGQNTASEVKSDDATPAPASPVVVSVHTVRPGG